MDQGRLKLPKPHSSCNFARSDRPPRQRRSSGGPDTPSSYVVSHLSSPSIYEVLCSPEANRFDIKDAAGQRLVSMNSTTRPIANKRAVFGAFFDVDTIDTLCHSHGFLFTDRYVQLARPSVLLLCICFKKCVTDTFLYLIGFPLSTDTLSASWGRLSLMAVVALVTLSRANTRIRGAQVWVS